MGWRREQPLRLETGLSFLARSCYNTKMGWRHSSAAKCLPCNHEDVSSIPSALEKRLGVVSCDCNLSAGEAATGGSLGLAGQPGQPS